MLIETGLTLASDVECSFCLYLPSGGTRDMYHHSWPKLNAWIWSLASFLHGQLQLGTMRTSDFFFSNRAISDQNFKATERVSSQSPEMKKRQKSNAAPERWNWTFWFYPSTGFYHMLGETAGYLSPGAHVPWGRAQCFSLQSTCTQTSAPELMQEAVRKRLFIDWPQNFILHFC